MLYHNNNYMINNYYDNNIEQNLKKIECDLEDNSNQMIKINLLIDILKEAFENYDLNNNINIKNNNINSNSICTTNIEYNQTYFILKDLNIKYPIQFKKINNIENKLSFIIKNTGNILYDYENSNKNEFYDLNIDLSMYGINRIFNFEDLINFYLYSFSYNDDERYDRFLYINNYLPKYSNINNVLNSEEFKINIRILNKIGIGTFGQIYNCEIYSLNNIQKFGQYVIKIIDLDKDEYYDLSQFFFEYLNHVIIFNEFKKYNFEYDNLIAKIPRIYYIGKILTENKIFIIIEKIEKTLYEKCKILVQNYIKCENSENFLLSQKKNILIKNSICLLNYIYQITHLLDKINSINYIKFVHNDLKLNNIMLNNNQCYLIDFGISNLKYKNFQIINSFPTNIILKKNKEIDEFGFNYYIFNNNIDVFHLIYNFYYFLFNINIQKNYPSVFFIKTIDDYFKNILNNIIYLDNKLIVKNHSDIYFFKLNFEMLHKINNNNNFNLKNIKKYSKIMLNLLLNN